MRIGVIGIDGVTDRWGTRAHLPAVRALEEAELIAVCTSREETAMRAQERTEAPLAFWDYEEMARSPEVDLVSVSVRISMHHPMVMAALAAGKPVFCEWPLSLNSELAAQMHTQARAAGVAHAVGTQARFSPGIMYAKELMTQAYVGRPLLFNMTHFLSSSIGSRPSHRWWVTQAAEGGGAILIALGHALDIVGWYLGGVIEVNAKVETLIGETHFSDTDEVAPVDAIDTVSCMARLAGGVTGNVHVSNVCHHGGGFRFEIYGTEGRLLVESPGMVQYSPARLYGSQGDEALHELPVPAHFHSVEGLAADSQALQVAQLLRTFIASIRDNTAFSPGFDEAVKLHRTIEAIERSSTSGSWETVAQG